ncbi:MAG: purine-nucleoside phosphorylase [Chlamydiales bacterium]|jgi:purine-nucleoside phosphorylase
MTDQVGAKRLALELAERGVGDVDLALVLGSGLGAFAEELENALVIPFEDVESMPCSAVPGHAGRWIVGEFGGARVLVQQGRVHLYEGWAVEQVVRAVRAYSELGCGALLITNAAGGLVADAELPGLMRIEDHINMQGQTPLSQAEAGRALPYDGPLGEIVDQVASERGIDLQRGVYVGLPGPSYETAAEIRMLARFDAHAVGMSTVCEAIAAHAAGIRVVGISCISNHAAGISATPLNHDEVVAAGARVAPQLLNLLQGVVPAVAAECGVASRRV